MHNSDENNPLCPVSTSLFDPTSQSVWTQTGNCLLKKGEKIFSVVSLTSGLESEQIKYWLTSLK